jgi:release factor glutamine methyltransferase
MPASSQERETPVVTTNTEPTLTRAPRSAILESTRRSAPARSPTRLLDEVVHFLSYRFILARRSTRVSHAAGLRLTVPPTVFHPGFFLTSEFFAAFIARLDLGGKRVVDVGTGTGILALAAARAGADNVLAIDINPKAVEAAAANASANGLAGRVAAVCSDLFSGVAPQLRFDVILSNPPFFCGEPRDVADRAWNAGPGCRDIAQLFVQARARLAPGGLMYVVLSSHADLGLFDELIVGAGFRWRIAAKRSILIEQLLIYELRPA